MGQYQQWLHYREVDKQLRSQLEICERELAQLQHRAQSAPQPEQSPQEGAFSEVQPAEKTALHSSLLAENKIIHALAVSLNGHSPETPEATPASNIEHTDTSAPNTPDESISSALFAWGSLANTENPGLLVKANSQPLNANPDQSLPPLSPTPRLSHEDITLLPEDMTSFIDEHTLTDPQIELPWWLRNIAAAARASQANGPIDQESVRTNRLVQRWLERWGRQPLQSGSHEEHKDE